MGELLPHLPRPSSSVARKRQRGSITLRLVRAVNAGLDALGADGRASSTDELIAFAARPISREMGCVVRDDGLFESALRSLPPDVLHALLATFHPDYSERMHRAHRQAFCELVLPWLKATFEQAVWLAREEMYDELQAGGWIPYPEAQATSRATWRRRVELVGGGSASSSDGGWLSDDEVLSVLSARAYLRPPTDTRQRERPGTNRLVERLRELTAEMSVTDVAAFVAKAKQGRPSAAEGRRLHALGRVASILHSEGHTLDAIGSLLDGRNANRVHELILIAEGRKASSRARPRR